MARGQSRIDFLEGEARRCRVSGLGFKVQGLGLRVRVLVLEFRVWGFLLKALFRELDDYKYQICYRTGAVSSVNP